MTNLSIIGLCNTQAQLNSLNLLNVICPGVPIAFIASPNATIQHPGKFQRLVPKYPVQSPDVDELLWQLPQLTATEYTVYVDMGAFCKFNPAVLEQAINQHSLIFSSPFYSRPEFNQMGIPHVGSHFIGFDKSKEAFDFFDNIRDIGRNWSQISVATCPASFRVKQLDTELGLACRLIDPDRKMYPVIDGFVQQPIDVIGNFLMKSGAPIPPCVLQHRLL